MTARHTISHADELYHGDVFYDPYSPDGRRGVRLAPLFVYQTGAVASADDDGIGVDLTSTAAATLTCTGAYASATGFDVPRNVTITSTANESGLTFTITGADVYGETMVENITGPNATTVSGVKAFSTFTSAYVSGDLTSTAVDIGVGEVLGLPVRITNADDIVSVMKDGDPVGGTYVAGMSTSDTSTATTADVRGTFTATAAPGGGRFTILINVSDNSSKAATFGVAQYGG